MTSSADSRCLTDPSLINLWDKWAQGRLHMTQWKATTPLELGSCPIWSACSHASVMHGCHSQWLIEHGLGSRAMSVERLPAMINFNWRHAAHAYRNAGRANLLRKSSDSHARGFILLSLCSLCSLKAVVGHGGGMLTIGSYPMHIEAGAGWRQ